MMIFYSSISHAQMNDILLGAAVKITRKTAWFLGIGFVLSFILLKQHMYGSWIGRHPYRRYIHLKILI